MIPIFLGLLGLYAAYKFVLFKRMTAKFNNWPGRVNLFHSFHPLGAIRTLWIGKRGREKRLSEARSPYEEAGWNIIAPKTVWPTASTLMISDADVIKKITHDHPAFPKPTRFYFGLARFGPNIVSTEGDDWRKHRRIVAPAFSEKNNHLVWEATISTVNDLIQDVWGLKNEVVVDQFLDITTHIALMVLSAAGFGIPLSWKQDDKPGPGHKLTFTRTLEAQAEGRIIRRARIPRFIAKRFKKTEFAYVSYHEMSLYLSEIILERQQAPDKEDRSDVLTNIIKGGDEGKQGFPALNVSELMGDTFVFLVAGHETTAHTLCYAFLLLAIFPDEQEKLYDHIKEVIGDREPVYEDHTKLTRVLAVFYEALRLYPIIMAFPKEAVEDCVFTATRADPNDPTTTQVHVPKGAILGIDIPAVHYNPRHWPDPQVFNPDRFLGDWNRDALIAFSGGLRACIGRRFSETEGVAAITMLLSQYNVSLKDEASYTLLPGETLEQRRRRIIKSDPQFTLTPDPLPLLFTRR